MGSVVSTCLVFATARSWTPLACQYALLTSTWRDKRLARSDSRWRRNAVVCLAIGSLMATLLPSAIRTVFPASHIFLGRARSRQCASVCRQQQPYRRVCRMCVLRQGGGVVSFCAARERILRPACSSLSSPLSLPLWKEQQNTPLEARKTDTLRSSHHGLLLKSDLISRRGTSTA